MAKKSGDDNGPVETLPTEGTANAEPAEDYKVGKGNPPLHSRFKDGHPYYPPKAKRLTSRIDEAIDQVLAEQVAVQGEEGIEYKDALVTLMGKLYYRAMQEDGKSTSATDLFVRLVREADARRVVEPEEVLNKEQSERIKENFLQRELASQATKATATKDTKLGEDEGEDA